MPDIRGINVACLSCVTGVSGWLPLYPQPVRSVHVRVQADPLGQLIGLLDLDMGRVYRYHCANMNTYQRCYYALVLLDRPVNAVTPNARLQGS